MLHISIKTPPAPSKSRSGLLYYAGGPFYTNAPGEKERGKRREKGKERRKERENEEKGNEERGTETQWTVSETHRPLHRRRRETPGCVILAAARISDAF